MKIMIPMLTALLCAPCCFTMNDLQYRAIPLLSIESEDDSVNIPIAAVPDPVPSACDPETVNDEEAYEKLDIVKQPHIVPEITITDEELSACDILYNYTAVMGAIKDVKMFSHHCRNRIYLNIHKAHDNHINNYIISFFPAAAGIHADIAQTIKEYLPVGTHQKERIWNNVGHKLQELKTEIENRRENSRQNRKCCCRCCTSSCLVGTLAGAILGALWCRYRCGISMFADVQTTCWEQPNLQCCGEQTMYGDPIPGIDGLDALNERISEMARAAHCTNDLSIFNGGGICAQKMDCAAVNTTSPNYYKNFNPCGPKPANSSQHAIKPSLARKIAMARDKQLKSKKNKK